MNRQTIIKLYTLFCHKSSIIKAIRQYRHGFSLVSSLVSLGIVGLVMSALISLLSIQQKDGRSIEQQLASASLKYHTLQMLRYKENCHCQFQSLPSIKGKSELSLTSLKSDCSPTAETIAETGKDIWAHTKISSIKVTNITPGRLIDGKNNNGEPDPSQNKKEYQAQLSIRFDQATQHRPMRDIELPIMFTAWDGSGNIIHCGASTDHNARLTSMNYKLRNTIYAHGGLLEQYDNMSGQADTNRGNIDENANTIEENDNSILQANTDIEANRILIASKQSKPHSHPLALSGHSHNSHITTREPESIIEEEPDPITTREPDPIIEEEPDPITTREPDPIIEEEPDPITTREPDPIIEEEPDPIIEEEPDPITTREPDPIIEEEPDPIIEEEPLPPPGNGGIITQPSSQCQPGWTYSARCDICHRCRGRSRLGCVGTRQWHNRSCQCVDTGCHSN